jgi:hypothetical protein
MTLAVLQQAFQAYVLEGADAVAERIEPGPLADPQRRLAIYYDAYRSRLVEALGADFEALIAVMGEEEFRSAARAYVEATPSTFRNVRWYGGRLAAFMRHVRPWREMPWLADLAEFEWTLTLAFDAADAPTVRFEDMAALAGDAWGTLAFHLHPCVQIAELRANAPAIRKAVDAGAAPPAPELAATAVPWLIWRKDLSPHFRSLSDPEAWALRAACAGHSFPEICAGLCEWIAAEEAAGAAAGWLRTWVDDQLIAELVST